MSTWTSHSRDHRFINESSLYASACWINSTFFFHFKILQTNSWRSRRLPHVWYRKTLFRYFHKHIYRLLRYFRSSISVHQSEYLCGRFAGLNAIRVTFLVTACLDVSQPRCKTVYKIRRFSLFRNSEKHKCTHTTNAYVQ